MFGLRLWLESLLSPVALIAWCLLGLLVVALRTPGTRRLRVAIAALCALYLAASLPLTADALFDSLQNRARRDARCGPPPPGSVIIVLAGGILRQPADPTDFNALRAQSLRRLIAAVAVARATPGSVLLISGGTGARYREADVMGALAQQMGIPAARIVLDRESRTTDASAVDTRSLPANRAPAPRYLLTSADHMPRALLAFRHRGQTVCAWPVDFDNVHLPLFERMTPQLGALEKTAMALHEYLGLAFYAGFKYR